MEIVCLIDFLGNFNETWLQLSEFLNEEKFDALQIFFLLGQFEGKLLELLI